MKQSAQHIRDCGGRNAPSPMHTLSREAGIEDLLGVDGRLFIWHGSERYLLRLTRQNRLLLTKEPVSE